MGVGLGAGMRVRTWLDLTAMHLSHAHAYVPESWAEALGAAALMAAPTLFKSDAILEVGPLTASTRSASGPSSDPRLRSDAYSDAIS